MESIVSPNDEATRAWNGPLFDRFVQFRHLMVGGLAPHGDVALAVHPPRADESDAPTCGPGPFSMANADTVSGQLMAAGFKDIALLRTDVHQLIGLDLEEAIDLVMSIGPAGEVLRLAGDRADHLRPQVVE